MLTTPHKYPFAINDDGKPIFIDDVTQENRRHTHYHCYGCGAELFPVLGGARKHHFRHEKDAICDPNKYLHEYVQYQIYRLINYLLLIPYKIFLLTNLKGLLS